MFPVFSHLNEPHRSSTGTSFANVSALKLLEKYTPFRNHSEENMSNQASGLLDTEQEWERKRHIQHAVLRHLHEIGPMNWSAVYVRFDRGAIGEIGELLKATTKENLQILSTA